MSPNSEIPLEKPALRAWAREHRDVNFVEASRGVAAQLERLPAFVNARHVLLYLALPEEIDVEALIHSNGSTNKKWYAPLCAPGRALKIYTYEPGTTQLRQGPFGLREPDPETSAEADPECIDLVLVPGLLFTPNGARLGNGGGYYDRFLPKLPAACFLVGVAADAQVVPALPCDQWDVKVSSVVTESAIYSKFQR